MASVGRAHKASFDVTDLLRDDPRTPSRHAAWLAMFARYPTRRVETGPSCVRAIRPRQHADTPNRISYLAIGVNFTSAPLSLVALKPSLARFVTT